MMDNTWIIDKDLVRVTNLLWAVYITVIRELSTEDEPDVAEDDILKALRPLGMVNQVILNGINDAYLSGFLRMCHRPNYKTGKIIAYSVMEDKIERKIEELKE